MAAAVALDVGEAMTTAAAVLSALPVPRGESAAATSLQDASHTRIVHVNLPMSCAQQSVHTALPRLSTTTHRNARVLHCSFVGCAKTFSKACKLADHERTHTGERPFACQHPGCTKKFGRKDHLQRHARSHVASSSKDVLIASTASSKREDVEQTDIAFARPFACTFATHKASSDAHDNVCGRRFLTRQHLDRHVKEYHDQSTSCGEERHAVGAEDADEERKKRKRTRRPGTYVCSIGDCTETFAKRKLLRAHINVYHSDKGKALEQLDEKEAARVARLPFPCTQHGCTKRFATNSKRMAHVDERHSSAMRYVCPYDHPTEQAGTAQFATWSELLAHQRQHHRPTCPFTLCGKEFKEQRSLRIHMQRYHAARDGQIGPDGSIALDDDDEEDEKQFDDTRNRVTLRQSKLERDWDMDDVPYACKIKGCKKRFGSRRALKRHSFKCSRHHAVSLPSNEYSDEADVSDNSEPTDVESYSDRESDDDFYRREGGAVPETSADRSKARRRKRASDVRSAARMPVDIGALTGSHYEVGVGDDGPRKKRRVRGRVLSCPWDEICRLRDHDEDKEEHDEERQTFTCSFRFSRLYDVQRHLHSRHGVHLSQLDIRSLLHDEEIRMLGAARPGTQIAKEEDVFDDNDNDDDDDDDEHETKDG